MGKDFQQEVVDLRAGLKAIQNVINNKSTNRIKHDRAIQNEQIQMARIEFFTRGYNFCKKEINAQRKLE